MTDLQPGFIAFPDNSDLSADIQALSAGRQSRRGSERPRSEIMIGRPRTKRSFSTAVPFQISDKGTSAEDSLSIAFPMAKSVFSRRVASTSAAGTSTTAIPEGYKAGQPARITVVGLSQPHTTRISDPNFHENFRCTAKSPAFHPAVTAPFQAHHNVDAEHLS